MTTALKNREREMFDYGLAILDLSLSEWKRTINDEDHMGVHSTKRTTSECILILDSH